MLGQSGFIRVTNREERMMVANILFREGYTVRPVRTKINGKNYDYLIHYEMQSQVVEDNGD